MGAGGGGDIGFSQMDEETEVFTTISEDILLNIFAKLEDDPRYLASLACVCTRFSSIIRTICWKKKCMKVIPGVVADLLRSGRPADKLEEPPGGWAALQKLAVCCPGLWHAGVLLESWDFGLERDIGPSEDYKIECRQIQNYASGEGTSETQVSTSSPWTLFDDLHFDLEYQGELGFVENEVGVLKNGGEIPIGASGHDLKGESSGFEQYPQAESAVGNNELGFVENSDEVRVLRNGEGIPIGDSGHDLKGQPSGFEQYPQAESGVENCELGFVENSNEVRVLRNGEEISIGESAHDRNGQPSGFDQYPQAESAENNCVLGFVENSNEVRVLRNGEGIPIGESGDDLNGQPSGFEQYPQAESEEKICNPSNPRNPSESQNSDCGNPDGVEMKRKESPCSDEGCDEDSKRRKKESHTIEPHLAAGVWNLTREQGNKLLQSRFRGDSLYICDLPGCIHYEEKRNYRLFRGVFKNFKSSHVWRNIKDMKAKKTVLNCCFCSSKGTWDMLTTFCLRRSFEYHDDGEPVVRAYVCENGHVAGAWTDRPMYN